MKICDRALNMIQVIDANGELRICGWMKNSLIGNLLDSSFEEIYAGEKAEKIRNKLAAGDYEYCDIDNCPYLANGTIEQHMVEIEEVPKYPEQLYLAYEGICNYHCTCCSSHGNMEMGRVGNWEKNYDMIEEKLKDVLPHIKLISAHGRGELFASRRILNLLANWQPLAPKEEIKVILETNGSLFNEKNWKKIENLGQYHLRVVITVMSFEEEAYQYLSGTKLPISNLISNLKYVKELREQGIINDFELATVLQERNFREMPEFVKRCFEEFGADTVRVRPIFLCGAQDRNIEWFADVRNPYHPYHQEYLKVMQHPIFKHPKVLMWSGEYLSTVGEHPGIANEKMLRNMNQAMHSSVRALDNLDKIIRLDNVAESLKKLVKCAGGNKLSVYGMGRAGKLLVKLCDDKNLFGELYDSKNYGNCCEGINVIHPDESRLKEKENVILVTVVSAFETIRQELEEKGFPGKICCLSELLKNCKEN